MGNLCESEQSERNTHTSLKAHQDTQVTQASNVQATIEKLHNDKKKIGKNDFTVMALVGKGAFGKVYKVVKKDGNAVYAMKVILKKTITDHNLEANNFFERNIMQKSDNPFIVKLRFAFQSKSKCYFVMDYVDGGELYKILQKLGPLPENVVRFLTAEIVLAMEYLHTDLKVLYRDLKPENVLLTDKGHVKLTDFGLATQIKESNSYTMAGTPEYLAPEIISRAGHSYEVDLWTLGILVYEMLAGYAPFTHAERNVLAIQKLILANKPQYTSVMTSDARSLIGGLLKFNPKERLGAKSFNDLKSHAFFKNLDFEQLSQQKLRSPMEAFALRNREDIESKLKPNNDLQKESYSVPHNNMERIVDFTYDPSSDMMDGGYKTSVKY